MSNLINPYRFAGGGLDPDTQALLSQAVIDGYTAASGSVLTALDTFIIKLKSDGVWNNVDAGWLYATNGDRDFAKYNIKDPTQFNCTEVNAVTFTSLQGFAGNGTDSYLNTGWDPSNDGSSFTLNSASIGVYVRTAPGASNRAYIGSNTGANNNYARIIKLGNGNTEFILNNATGRTDLLPANDGFITYNQDQGRPAGQEGRAYRNGVQEVNGTQNVNSLSTEDIYVGASNTAGTANFFTTSEIAFAFVGGDLDAEASDFYDAIQDYMTTLGTQV